MIELPQHPSAARPIRRQPRGFDLLALPGVRRFVRWKYARLVFQLPLLALAVLVIWDGFSGRQLAPRNVATTASWLHYRGLVVVALALVGNAFCAACPLLLTRGPSKLLSRLLPAKLRWPRRLKSKWLVTALLLALFFSYERFDLWASPWLTAWLAVAYFAGALLVDTLFPAGTFCRYLCPLGNFNFTYAALSPSQITAVDHDVCRRCEHKPCLHGRESYADPARARGAAAFIPLAEVTHANGEGHFPGCETNLFVPTLQSNMDCTHCFNCVRACPYDNVALTLRSPGWELQRNAWARRGRLPLILMGVLLCFWGVLNAVAMTGPFYGFAEWLAAAIGSRSETLLLALLFAVVSVGGVAVSGAVALAADLLGGAPALPPLPYAKRALMRWGYVLVALGFGFWAAHYLFHFLTGALSIVPVLEHFFAYRGAPLDPNWRLAQLVPSRWLFPVTASIASLYALVGCWLTVRIGLRDFGRRGVLAMWPVLLFVLAFTALQVLVLAQPMEMRGTILGPMSP